MPFYKVKNSTNPTEKYQLLNDLQIKIIKNKDDLELLKEWISHAIDESVGLVLSRQLLNDFITNLKSQENISAFVPVLEYALSQTSERQTAFEEQIQQIREILADISQENEDYIDAANYLIGIPLDTGNRTVSDEYKLQIYIRIARLFLEEDESGPAEAYINRAGFLVSENTPKILLFQFKAAQAKIMDMKRQFLPAASKYLELSLIMEIHESERLSALKQSVICTILAGAGPARSKILSILYKDDRVNTFQEHGINTMLEKMVLGQLVYKKAITDFSTALSPHQLATTADGSTVFDKAVMEHNLLSVSKLYVNISFQQLGILLNISASQAEQVASSMMFEGRMKGHIDQTDNLIYFDNEETIETWNSEIAGLCMNMDDIIENIHKKIPEWINNRMI